MALATAAFPWGFGAGNADNEQWIEAFSDWIRSVHVIKPKVTSHPDKLRVRDIQHSPVRKIDGEWNKRLAIQTPSDFTDHDKGGDFVSGVCPAFPFPTGSLIHGDDRRGIEIFGGVQLFVEKQQYIPRSRTHCLAVCNEQLPPVAQSNDEGLEWNLLLPGFYFLQHVGTVQTARVIRKAYF